MRLSLIGLTLSSSWGNGHATTYRALLSGLAELGHEVTFYECDRPWYAAHRDLPNPDFAELVFYNEVEDLQRHRARIANADAVIVGSYVVDGIAAARATRDLVRGPVLFYDIDTPVTLAAVDAGTCAYLDRPTIAAYDAYLSFTGGPTLRRLEQAYGARKAHALYCSVDPREHEPQSMQRDVALGYLGTYSADRQPGLERLLIEPARACPDLRFVVAGPQYPADIAWPANVERIEHVGPEHHAAFYGRCRYTLNLTRADMRAAGWSPSVRLFEAAATNTPILSDMWPGLEDVLVPGREILTVARAEDVISILSDADENLPRQVAAAARERVLSSHTHLHRAGELVAILDETIATSRAPERKLQLAP